MRTAHGLKKSLSGEGEKTWLYLIPLLNSSNITDLVLASLLDEKEL